MAEYGDVYVTMKFYDSDNNSLSYSYGGKNWSSLGTSVVHDDEDFYSGGLTNVWNPHIFWDESQHEIFDSTCCEGIIGRLLTF